MDNPLIGWALVSVTNELLMSLMVDLFIKSIFRLNLSQQHFLCDINRIDWAEDEVKAIRASVLYITGHR